MNAAAADPNNAITGLDTLSVNDGIFVDNGNAESGQVVATRRIKTGHFSGFSPEQRATALAAAIGNPFNHGGHGVRAQGTGGHVVEKEERFGATRDHIVHAHRHQIDADVVMGLVLLG